MVGLEYSISCRIPHLAITRSLLRCGFYIFLCIYREWMKDSLWSSSGGPVPECFISFGWGYSFEHKIRSSDSVRGKNLLLTRLKLFMEVTNLLTTLGRVTRAVSWTSAAGSRVVTTLRDCQLCNDRTRAAWVVIHAWNRFGRIFLINWWGSDLLRSGLCLATVLWVEVLQVLLDVLNWSMS